MAGGTLQSVARNPLASPDTLGVNAGAYVSVVAVAAFGISLPFVGRRARRVPRRSRRRRPGAARLARRGGRPARLVLAGSAIALALNALTSVLLMLFAQNTVGLFAWGSGTTVQSGSPRSRWPRRRWPPGCSATLLLSHRLDVLGLGDDSARVLGVDVRRTRLLAVLLAVMLAATAVTVAGPIGFVGLCAPVIARLVARRVPGPRPAPAAAAARRRDRRPGDRRPPTCCCGRSSRGPSDLGADRRGHHAGRRGPAGLARPAAARRRTGRRADPRHHGTVRSRRWVAVPVRRWASRWSARSSAALLLGDRLVLLGDVANWWRGASGREVSFVLDQRWPRVAAALLGGAALALAGTIVQAVCRNPLAEPSLLGVTPGASVGAIAIVLLLPGVGVWPVMGAATAAALVTFALVYRLAAGRGLSSDRIVLIGIGVSAAGTAITTLVVVVASPVERQPRADLARRAPPTAAAPARSRRWRCACWWPCRSR